MELLSTCYSLRHVRDPCLFIQFLLLIKKSSTSYLSLGRKLYDKYCVIEHDGSVCWHDAYRVYFVAKDILKYNERLHVTCNSNLSVNIQNELISLCIKQQMDQEKRKCELEFVQQVLWR